MAVTPFRHIDFVKHEPVTKEKLDQFQSNIQWIVDHTPITLHVNDLQQASISNIIVVGGRVPLNIYGTWAWGRAWFDGAFDSTTNPVVTLGLNSEKFKQVYSTMSGIDIAVLPDARGFDFTVVVNDAVGAGELVYVNWMAMGKRSVDYDRF